jgi:D-amino-acid dehydrogenase
LARTDAVVLGAGIVGTSIALELARRGLAVALIDRKAPGEETSYGNAGIIEGNTVLPHAFPAGLRALLRIALKRAPEANYHVAFLPTVLPWLLDFRAASRPERRAETARVMRPLFERAVADHEALLTESRANRYLRTDGWLKVYRSDAGLAAIRPELLLAAEFGIPHQVLDREGVQALEPNLGAAARHAVFWPGVASVSNPLAVTRAYAARLAELGGVVLLGDARSLHRSSGEWRVDTAEGPVDSREAVVALGPFAPEVLVPLGIKLPLGVKRGYHRHFRAGGNASLTRPVVDAEVGYCLAPMEQGLRLTTGAEFAARDVPPTPVQFDRLLPAARQMFPLGEPAEATTWMGSRPCFADSRPVIGQAPGQPGMWLAYGHAHWGLTLGPTTGVLMADLITGATPFCDPAPFGAERFIR